MLFLPGPASCRPTITTEPARATLGHPMPGGPQQPRHLESLPALVLPAASSPDEESSSSDSSDCKSSTMERRGPGKGSRTGVGVIRALPVPTRAPPAQGHMELLEITIPKMHPGKCASEVPVLRRSLPPFSKNSVRGHPLPEGPAGSPTPYLPGPACRPLAPGLRQERRAPPLPKPEEQPPSALGVQISLPEARMRQLRPGRVRWPEPQAPPAHCTPTRACPAPQQALPLLLAHRPPLSPEAPSSSPLQTILVYIPVTKATEGHKALNYLGHVTRLQQVPPPVPTVKNPWKARGLPAPIPQAPWQLGVSIPSHAPPIRPQPSRKDSRL